MCLAKPLKIIEIDRAGSTAKVEIGGGEMQIGIELVPEANPGDFVLVHAGMAIELLQDEDAESILDAYEKYVESDSRIAPGENL